MRNISNPFLFHRFDRRSGRSEVLSSRGETTAPPTPICGPLYCDCKRNGSYFVTQNTFGNFRDSAPQSDAGVTDQNYVKAASLLAEVFHSSAVACQQIQDYYRQCSWLETEPRYSFWLVNCKTWETLISDPTYGIYCDLETILRVDSAKNHEYQSATEHPYPRRRGIVVAFWLQEWSTHRVLIEKRIVCDEPQDCKYSNGGLFVTHQARNLSTCQHAVIIIQSWNSMSIVDQSKTMSALMMDLKLWIASGCSEVSGAPVNASRNGTHLR
mmetsp:Transcript_17144/g.52722  ORF Transcript_17144/g.52722 Transcript_17144/m.52722 type:complete len:269 (+) Transcript_17144:2411-3217(+)